MILGLPQITSELQEALKIFHINKQNIMIHYYTISVLKLTSLT